MKFALGLSKNIMHAAERMAILLEDVMRQMDKCGVIKGIFIGKYINIKVQTE